MTRMPAAGQNRLRQLNLASVVDAVFGAETPLSRAGVATRTGLTKATVSTLVDRLVRTGIVRELPLPDPRGVGRPGVPLAPRGRSLVGVGLEVNVGYYGGRVLDLTGSVVAEAVVELDLVGSEPASVLGELGILARGLMDQVEAQGMWVAGARLALPGLVRPQSGALEIAPNMGWRDLDPVSLLGLGGVQVEVRNEAKLAGLAQTPMPPALSESEIANGLPATFIYVSGGVGIGSAILIERTLFEGQHGWSGEVGHVVVNPGGPHCRCGNRGCLEQYAGKSAILGRAGLGRNASIPELVALLDAGELEARTAVGRAADALGRALADYVNIVDVEAIVLGGIYAPLFEAIAGVVRERLDDGVLAARHAPISVLIAPQQEYAALTGGARDVLRGVLADPSAWLTRGASR